MAAGKMPLYELRAGGAAFAEEMQRRIAAEKAAEAAATVTPAAEAAGVVIREAKPTRSLLDRLLPWRKEKRVDVSPTPHEATPAAEAAPPLPEPTVPLKAVEPPPLPASPPPLPKAEPVVPPPLPEPTVPLKAVEPPPLPASPPPLPKAAVPPPLPEPTVPLRAVEPPPLPEPTVPLRAVEPPPLPASPPPLPKAEPVVPPPLPNTAATVEAAAEVAKAEAGLLSRIGAGLKAAPTTFKESGLGGKALRIGGATVALGAMYDGGKRVINSFSSEVDPETGQKKGGIGKAVVGTVEALGGAALGVYALTAGAKTGLGRGA